MNTQIKSLYQRAGKASKLIIGLMSGTSMDGLDIVLCEVSGHGASTDIKVLHSKTASYSAEFRRQLKSIFANRNADLQLVCLMNEYIGNLHGSLINEALSEWGYKNEQIDFIASHGQTIFHAPKSQHQIDTLPNGTLQIGDGDHIAVKTGIITISDFRQKHLASGGEGAPLAVYGDYLMFSRMGEERIMLNIGGIANLTYLPENLAASEVFSTDIGPGNTIMDQFVQKYFDKFYDDNSAIARAGQIDEHLLSALLDNDFFERDFPKTTGPEVFNLNYLEQAQRKSKTELLSKEDVMATLCHFTAEAISTAIKKCSKASSGAKVFASGGGIHNPMLWSLLKQKLPDFEICTTNELGILPDAKEAVLFIVLANETLCGEAINFGSEKGVPTTFMGKISLPN